MGPPVQLTPIGILGIEVVQCVQDLKNSVPLIAGKPTMVRVYFDPATVTQLTPIGAELAWSRGGAETFLPPTSGSLLLGPTSPVSLQQQRATLFRSIGFRLPPQAVAAGTLRLRISRLFRPFVGVGGDLPVDSTKVTTVTFIDAPPLRIRVIGLRYKDGTATVAPAAVHFAYLKSFLLRAYPIASIEWSQVVVDADFGPPFDDNTSSLANAQIAALRSREVSSGVDPRTHYYGLVDDNGGKNFMRGESFPVPDTPHPDVVASGPAGVPNGYKGDSDASYADWYGAHELGHTFGRSHPGFPPPPEQDRSDQLFPFADGCISSPANEFAGLDIGDPELGLRPSALSGLLHHDIMTYSDNQWISPYTYQGILAWLKQEDALGPPVT
jgi:hypothetical protein